MASPLARHTHSHARTLTCFAFRGKERLLAVYSQAISDHFFFFQIRHYQVPLTGHWRSLTASTWANTKRSKSTMKKKKTEKSEIKKLWQAYTTPAVRKCNFFDFRVWISRVCPSDFPLLYEMMGGSLYISLSRGWFCIKFHLLIKIFFKLGTAGWYCLTKGRILLCVLFFCWNAYFLSSNFIFERTLFTRVSG